MQFYAREHGSHIIEQGEEHRHLCAGFLVPADNAHAAHAPRRDGEDGVGAENLEAGAQRQFDVAPDAGGDARGYLVFVSCELINNRHDSFPPTPL
ncbi:hypothetical protein SDC9_160844 [bioreactor metagenome]|uniref:Uncharacterized protein n=1 Tax=bioreactor metagenome TaxID=1076179 RepID=A0A645FMU9_9ZZZZ